MSLSVFITGASAGLGKATAERFAAAGWQVYATMRNPEAVPEWRDRPELHVLALDVTDPQAIRKVVDQVLSQTAIDVVINNAGYGLAGPFEGASDADLQKQIGTNLLGVMRVTQAFLPHFRERGRGTFVHITSVGGNMTLPLNSVYHSTKWALEGWNESLAFELAPLGILTKTVAPGSITTDFAGRSLVMTAHPAYQTMVEKALQALRRQRRPSTAQAIADEVFTAATDGKAQFRYIAGDDARRVLGLRRWLGAPRFHRLVQKRFFG